MEFAQRFGNDRPWSYVQGPIGISTAQQVMCSNESSSAVEVHRVYKKIWGNQFGSRIMFNSLAGVARELHERFGQSPT